MAKSEVTHKLRVMRGRWHRHLMVVSYCGKMTPHNDPFIEGGVAYMPQFSCNTSVDVNCDYETLRNRIAQAKEANERNLFWQECKAYPLRFC